MKANNNKMIDIKMLQVIEVLKVSGTINFDNDFAKEIGLKKQNLYRIKQGVAHFQSYHIQNVCSKYNVNANWLMGLDKKMFRTKAFALPKL